jgi:hypothetical protein
VHISAERAVVLDERANYLINAHEIPYSRYGVLYLLGNIDLKLDIGGIVLEGVGAVGGVVGSAVTTNFSEVGNLAKSSQVLTTVRGVPVTGRAAVSGAQGVTTVAGTIVGTGGTVTAKPPPVGDPTNWFPATEKAATAAAASIRDDYDHGRYFTMVAKGVGATIAAPVVVPVTLLMDGARALYLAAKSLWDSLMNLFKGLGKMIKKKFEDKLFLGKSIGQIIKGVTKFAVDMVMKNAVPFLAGAMDMGTGLVRAIEATCIRIASYLDRRKIRIQPGHPEETANTIEHAMDIGIFKGLGDILKGGAKTMVSMLAPGLGSLVSCAIAAIEWVVKMVYRICECNAIDTFLKKARAEFLIEQGKAQLQPSPGHVKKAQGASTSLPARGHLEPLIDGNGIISDTERFTLLFKEGCDASPLIPMLTLNSGICGSLMTMIKLFDDGGPMTVDQGAKRQQFDIGGEYFTRLKRYAVEYLKSGGFQFTPLAPAGEQGDFLRGLLAHATGAVRDAGGGKTMASHVAPQTLGNAVLAGLKS